MALRTIRTIGDEVLRKKSRTVDKIDKRILTLLDDMVDTMYESDGIGLAGPQVGILKRVVVVDIGDGPIYLINPVILEAKGSEIDSEGCLSIPNENGDVDRPTWIKVNALNEKGENYTFEANDLFARAICHEVDHLDGILFIDKVIETEENK